LVLSVNMGGGSANKRPHHASFQWNKNAQHDGRFSAQWQSEAPSGPGYGYRLSSTQLDEGVLNDGALLVHTKTNALLFGVSQHRGDLGYQFGATGAVASIGGNSFFSREINDSFAVVKVDTHPNVRIYRDNTVVAHTNEKGVALVPGLRAYEANNLRFEHEDLPIDATVTDTELDVAPRFRSGLMIEFAVRTNRYVWVKLVDAQGAPLAAGTRVHIDEDPQTYYVALRGETYIANLASGPHRLAAQSSGATCDAFIDVPQRKDSLLRLGTIACIGAP
jgi:outer membrane usher protein